MDNLQHNNVPASYKSLDMARLKGCIPVWRREGLFSDPRKAREKLLGLVAEAHASAMLGQLKQAGIIHKIYRSLEPHCTVDPVALSYDNGLLLFTCLYAEIAALRRNWDGAYECCASILDYIPCIQQRIEVAGGPVPKYSEVRWIVLRTLADCKWQDVEGERDRLLKPEQIVAEFLSLNAEIMPQLQTDDFYDDEDNQNLIDSLRLCHFNICKMSYRFLPAVTTVNLVMRYNHQCNAPILAVSEGAWRRSDLAERPQRYFDFEIAKSFIAGKLSIQDLDHLHQLRIDARNVTNESAPLYSRALQLEYDWMAKRCFRQLEVMGA